MLYQRALKGWPTDFVLSDTSRTRLPRDGSPTPSVPSLTILGHLFIYLYTCCLFNDAARSSDWSSHSSLLQTPDYTTPSPKIAGQTRIPDTALRYLQHPLWTRGQWVIIKQQYITWPTPVCAASLMMQSRGHR